MFARLLIVCATLAAVASGCGSDGEGGSGGGGNTVDLSNARPATFAVTPNVEHVTITGAVPRRPLTLVYADSLERIVTLYTDSRGQLVFQYVPDQFLVHDPATGVIPTNEGRSVAPGTYRVVSEGVPGEPFAGPIETSPPFRVLAPSDIPDPALYDNQVLPAVATSILGGVQEGFTDEDGYGYLMVRDGTLLSVNVRLPDPQLYGDGPYPTVVQYSGYAPSRPGDPAGADATGRLALSFGFAYVGVNMRGTGCSGGVFDAFNPAQAADGYDVIEVVARQPWVKHGRVGMIGISYSGVSQLYVAALNPPSLAAITPLSVIEDPWYQQWPGVIYNAGFTRQWIASRESESLGGQQWVRDRIAAGDATCIANQQIRSQNIPYEEFAKSLTPRPREADTRNLSLQVRKINVPVFLAGAWQDEQTGPRFGLMLDDFVSVPSGKSRFTVYNGHHQDALSPHTQGRWFEFLSFYVDRSVPRINRLVRTFAPEVLRDIFGVPGMSFEADRFASTFRDYELALAAYEAELPVRVLYEVGASPDFPDYPMAQRQRFEMQLAAWPPPQAQARTFFLGPDGTLTDEAPATTGVDRFQFDAEVLGTDYYVRGDHTGIDVVNDWKVTADGRGLAYETAPLSENLVVAGEGYLDLWLRSTGTDAPLEIVLSEVYAEVGGVAEEVRVQHGLLRAGFRTLDPARSKGLQVDHLFTKDGYQPLPPGQFVNVKVPLYSVTHPFRSGSRLRIEINTPGGDAALWSFESESYGATTHDVARGGVMASKLVLSVLPNDEPTLRIPERFAPQSERPPCDSLRGQPCRRYKHLDNAAIPAPGV
jgi:predicted acyl esterase